MKRNTPFIILSFVLVMIIAGAFGSVGILSEWLFFEEVGYVDIFTKVLFAKILTGTVLGSVTLVFLSMNLLLANRYDFPRSTLSPFRNDLYGIDFKKYDLNKIVKKISLYLIFLVSVFAAMTGTRFWEKALLFLNSQPAGVSDPLFGKDIAFYLFNLPLLDALNGALSILILVGVLFTALNYFLRGGVVAIEGLISLDVRVKKHIALLVSLFILNLSFKFYLDRFTLLLSEHGVLYGASYTDVHARLLMLNIITAIAFAAAILFFVGISARSKYIPIIPLIVLGGVYLLGVLIYPSLLQSFKVSPNEIVLERPYIKHHIQLTRYGYGLERIQTEPFVVGEELAFSDIEENISTIGNIRLWDEEPLLKTYSQLQQIRTYYKFIDVDNDRYEVDGKYMQVMLSPREISYEDLPGRSWINERLVYTHGIGLSMGPVSSITREGLPEFIIKDIPPVSTSGLKVTRPEIYYGENPNEYVVVNTKLKEFSYPTTEGNVYTRYAGTGGVQLSSFLRGIIYAVHFRNFKLLLSGDITPESRILYNRNIMDRVDTVAPFLLYDDDPYMVASEDGRLYWIIDAYSVTDRVPYSKPVQRGINYIRNAVKVVVDAYNGSLSFYIVDPEDVVVQTYKEIFPALFRGIDEMPEGLRKHIRYPRSLLRVQASMYSLFHMTDPGVFYNKEDLWEIPSYKGRTMEPYYIIMKLPQGEREEFALLLPFTPAKRDNLAAWMAARCDGDDYGKVVVYTFPRDRLVFGPRQIDARIDQNAYISQQLTLWGQRGSDVIRGSLLIIPIENALLYVQPLFLVATDRGGLPELRRVIAAFGSEVVMENTLEAAINKLFKGSLPEGPMIREIEERVEALSEQGIGRKALESLQRAREALRKEDWSGFGEHFKKAEEFLRELSK